MSSIINAIKSILHSMLQLFWFGKKTITNSLSIYIKTSGGSTISVDLDPTWDIKNVKEIVAPKLGLEPEEVKIIFAGKELGDNITISECDLGQKSILHAVKIKSRPKLPQPRHSLIDEDEEQGSKPLCETLRDTMFSNEDGSRNSANAEDDSSSTKVDKKVHFYVFCPTCKALKHGKLRVRCHFCKSGAFTVHSDPQNWNDVLIPKQITGLCENSPELCANLLDNLEPTFAEFYFKCSEHTSLGEQDQAVPLYLIRPNLSNVPCLACADVSDPVFVFPCPEGHVTCLDCFRQYCITKLNERQFWQHPQLGYTLACPAGCVDSFIKEIHHFRLLTDNQRVAAALKISLRTVSRISEGVKSDANLESPKKKRSYIKRVTNTATLDTSAIREVIYNMYHKICPVPTFWNRRIRPQIWGVLCPQPGCGMGILVDDPDCMKITCINGCGYVFCRNCLQGYHIGECDSVEDGLKNSGSGGCYSVDPARVADARWDEASKVAIKVLTKPCPKCRTPTERDGGCMHMICTRAGCGFHWCWVCQTDWTRDCMGSHWFG